MEKKETKKYKAKMERRRIRKAFRDFSINVRMRDGNKCTICGTDKYIHAHHIFPKELKDFRFNIDNGISLCAKHHKYNFEISAHKNPVAFLFWLKKSRPTQWEFISRVQNKKK